MGMEDGTPDLKLPSGGQEGRIFVSLSSRDIKND